MNWWPQHHGSRVRDAALRVSLEQTLHHYEMINLKTSMVWTTIQTIRGPSVKPMSMPWSREPREPQLHSGYRNELLLHFISKPVMIFNYFLLDSIYSVGRILCNWRDFYKAPINTNLYERPKQIQQFKSQHLNLSPIKWNTLFKNINWQITMYNKLRYLLGCHLPTGYNMVI